MRESFLAPRARESLIPPPSLSDVQTLTTAPVIGCPDARRHAAAPESRGLIADTARRYYRMSKIIRPPVDPAARLCASAPSCLSVLSDVQTPVARSAQLLEHAQIDHTKICAPSPPAPQTADSIGPLAHLRVKVRNHHANLRRCPAPAFPVRKASVRGPTEQRTKSGRASSCRRRGAVPCAQVIVPQHVTAFGLLADALMLPWKSAVPVQALAIPRPGNVQVAIQHTPGAWSWLTEWIKSFSHEPFSWFEAIAPPVFTLIAGLVLKEVALESIQRRHENERAYQTALADWKAATDDPEALPAFRSAYANALRDQLQKVNARGRGQRERIEIMQSMTTDDWRALVQRELQADSWFADVPGVTLAPAVRYSESTQKSPAERTSDSPLSASPVMGRNGHN